MPVASPTARDLMTPRPTTLPHDAPLSTAIGLMRSKGVHEIPVLRGKVLVGLITFETIARRTNLPLQTKVEHLVVLPPLVSERTPFGEIAEQLLASGLRAAPVVGKKGEIVGIVSRTDLIRAFPTVLEIARHRVEEVASPPAATLKESEPVATLFAQIRQLEEHPFPVEDRKGRLVGAVGVADLVRVLWRPTVGGKRDASRPGSLREVEVGSIMHSPALTVESGTTVGAAAKRMTAEKVSSVFVVAEGKLLGVVSQVDLLGLAIGRESPGGALEGDVYVQITGLRGSSDPEMLGEIDRVVAKGLRHISRHLRPTLLSLRVSPQGAHRTGDAVVQARLHTERGIFYASVTGWNFFAGIAALMDDLETQARRVRENAPARLHGSRRRLAQDDSMSDPELEARLRAATGEGEE